MRKTTRKSAKSIRALIERINSDDEERFRFLLDPSESLSKVGIVLNAKAKKELQVLIREFLERYPEIVLLPTGLTRTGARGAGRRGGGAAGERRLCMFIV